MATLAFVLPGSLSLEAAAAESLVVDDFGRPDAATLGTAPTGQSWTQHAGEWRIRSGQAAPEPGYALATVDAGRSDLSVAATVATPSNEFWLVLRLSDNANYWRFGRSGGGAYQLQQVHNNALGSPPITSLATVSPAAGDRLECSLGSTLTCSVNGNVVLRTADTFNVTATRAGLASWDTGATALRIDDLVVRTLPPPPTVPDLEIALSSPGSVAVGDPVTVTATVTNKGTAATGAGLTVTVPTDLAGTADGCARNADQVTCSIEMLAPGTSVTRELLLMAPSGAGSHTLVATVTASSGTDPNPGDNSASRTLRVVVPPPADAVVVDDFDRADASSLGTATSGQGWTSHAGDWQIRGGRAAPNPGYALSTVDTGRPDVVVAATVVTPSPEFWFVLRLADGANYWRFGRTGGGAYQLQQVQNNSLGSPVVATPATLTPSTGDRIECSVGGILSCTVNGTTVVRTGDGFNASATKVGFASWDTASTPLMLDDLLVRGLPPAPDLAVALGGPGRVDTGGQVTVTVTVTNRGTAATATTVEVTVPAALTGSAAECTRAAEKVTCALSPLEPGASVTRLLNLTAPATTSTYALTASAPATTGTDSNPDDNAAIRNLRVTPPTPEDAVVLDDFDRADASALGGATSGQTWTTHAGEWRIRSEQAAPTAGYAIATIDGGQADLAVSATATTVSPEFWMVLRFSDSANYWRFGRSGGGSYQLQQVRGFGLGSPALSVQAVVTPAAGDRLECVLGSTIACSVNGVAVVRTTDGFNAGASKVGLSSWETGSSTPLRIDDLLVRALPPPPAVPDLRVTLSSPGSVTVGGSVNLTAVVTNDGTASTAATLGFTVPPDLLGSAPGCTRTQSTVSCPVSTLAPGESASKVLALTAPGEPATYTLSATAAASTGTDPNPADNTATRTLRVTTPPPADAAARDSFDRPDSPSLGTAVSGQDWNDPAGVWRVRSGQAESTGTGVASLETGFSYGTFEVTLGAGSSLSFGLAVRIADGQNRFEVRRDAVTGAYTLVRIQQGQATRPTFLNVRRELQPQDGDRIRIVNRPDDGFFVAVNGEHIIDAGDQALLDATGIALVARAAGVRFDDVSGTQRMEGVPATDTFNRANSDQLGAPESGSSYPWTHWLGAFGVVNGQAFHDSPYYGLSVVDTSTEGATSRVRLAQLGPEMALVFSYTPEHGYFRFGYNGNQPYTIDYVTDDGSGQIPGGVQVHVSRMPHAGDMLVVRTQADGTVEGLVNGTLVASFKGVTANARGTEYGMAASGSSGRFDDFSVD